MAVQFHDAIARGPLFILTMVSAVPSGPERAVATSKRTVQRASESCMATSIRSTSPSPWKRSGSAALKSPSPLRSR